MPVAYCNFRQYTSVFVFGQTHVCMILEEVSRWGSGRNTATPLMTLSLISYICLEYGCIDGVSLGGIPTLLFSLETVSPSLVNERYGSAIVSYMKSIGHLTYQFVPTGNIRVAFRSAYSLERIPPLHSWCMRFSHTLLGSWLLFCTETRMHQTFERDVLYGLFIILTSVTRKTLPFSSSFWNSLLNI